MTSPKSSFTLITVQQRLKAPPKTRDLHVRELLFTSNSVLVATDTENIKKIVDHQAICCNSVRLRTDTSKSGLL